MTDQAERTVARAILTAAEPQAFVADIKASCDFFTEKLGFSIVFVYGEPPFCAMVKRDRACIGLRCVERALIDRDVVERESLLAAAVTVETADEIKQLYLEFQAAGVAFHQTLQRRPGGRAISSRATWTATCCCSPARRSKVTKECVVLARAGTHDL